MVVAPRVPPARLFTSGGRFAMTVIEKRGIIEACSRTVSIFHHYPGGPGL